MAAAKAAIAVAVKATRAMPLPATAGAKGKELRLAADALEEAASHVTSNGDAAVVEKLVQDAVQVACPLTPPLPLTS